MAKKIFYFFKWLLVSLFGLFIILVIFIHTIDFSLSDEEIDRAFQGLSYNPTFSIVESDIGEIHYVAIGDTSKPKVIFVHGSPGSWDNFARFLSNSELLESFRLISFDRPGYGKSNPGQPVRSLTDQAGVIEAILENENKSTSNILVGHSYGGPVIAKFAMDYPKHTQGVIFVAASVDPKLEETKWFQVPVHYKVFSWILPDMLYSSNEEIIALKNELKLMENDWDKIQIPVSIIQGTEDRLVPYENAEYLKTKLSNAVVQIIVKDINHFIPWEHPDLIEKEIFRIKESPN